MNNGQHDFLRSQLPRMRHGTGVFLIAALLTSCAAGTAFAEMPSAREYELKAVFVQKLIEFIEWPDTAFADGSDNLTITVFGKNPFGGSLSEALTDQNLHNRHVRVRHTTTLEDVLPTQVIFIPESERHLLGKILAVIGSTPVLTIGDFEGFCQNGGTVNLYMSDNRVQLVVNTAASDRAQLSISSRLLRLATAVGGKHQG